MEFNIEITKLKINTMGDFNIITVLNIKSVLEKEKDIDELEFDLKEARFIDSEGIRFIYQLHKEGKTIKILNPPSIFYKVIQILKLESVFKKLILS